MGLLLPKMDFIQISDSNLRYTRYNKYRIVDKTALAYLSFHGSFLSGLGSHICIINEHDSYRRCKAINFTLLITLIKVTKLTF
jgi:hypothetical protein